MRRRVVFYKDNDVLQSTFLDYLAKFKGKDHAYSVICVTPSETKYIRGIYDYDTLVQYIDDCEWESELIVVQYSDYKSTFPPNKNMIYPIDAISYPDEKSDFKKVGIDAPLFIVGFPALGLTSPIKDEEDRRIEDIIRKMSIKQAIDFFDTPNFFVTRDLKLDTSVVVIGVDNKTNSIEIYNKERMTQVECGVYVLWTHLYEEGVTKDTPEELPDTPEEIIEIKESEQKAFHVRDFFEEPLPLGALLQVHYIDDNDLDYTANYLFSSETKEDSGIMVQNAFAYNAVAKKINTKNLQYTTAFKVEISEN